MSLLLVGILVLGGYLGWQLIQTPDPYVQQVLVMIGNAQRGQSIFQINCAGCHGSEGTGRVGPSLLGVSDHKSQVRLIQQVVSGKTPPMPQFQPSPQEMADLLAYLESL